MGHRQKTLLEKKYCTFIKIIQRIINDKFWFIYDAPYQKMILHQQKWYGMASLHRVEKNTIIAGTDIPGYSKEKPPNEHYSQKTREENTFFGLHNVYKDQLAANENIQLKIVPPFTVEKL